MEDAGIGFTEVVDTSQQRDPEGNLAESIWMGCAGTIASSGDNLL
jgi:hypothetical protein